MKSNFVCSLVILVLLSTLPVAKATDTFTIMHDFGLGSDGYTPNGDLTMIGSTIYGTTTGGGSSGGGTVFKINSNGSGYGILYNFYSNGGIAPRSGLSSDGSNLFGTTSKNKLSQDWGGSVYQISVNGNLTVLHDFEQYYTPLSYGDPRSRPTIIGSTLYGTTHYGGEHGGGIIYAVDLDDHDYRVMHSFNSDDYSYSTSDAFPLTAGDSKLYGATENGGAYGKGSIYQINADGTGYEVIHSFNGSDGDSPISLRGGGLLLAGSTLYGTTDFGGQHGVGTVFKLDTSDMSFAVLHSFSGIDGSDPCSGLVLCGSSLYGNTNSGGENGKGVIYRIGTDGNGFNVLHSFDFGEESQVGGMVTDGTKLYGISRYGGSHGTGMLYSLTIPEPSTLVLLGVGLVSLLAGGRRRHSAFSHLRLKQLP